ncbi:TPA: glycoside hydrolase family protein, partial [Pseudomonas putida]|nr:glycoside hydrolase family protein [Pseudomonas putida]
NAGNYAAAADQFPRWNKAGGQVLAGLVRRRSAERDLFLGAA